MNRRRRQPETPSSLDERETSLEENILGASAMMDPLEMILEKLNGQDKEELKNNFGIFYNVITSSPILNMREVHWDMTGLDNSKITRFFSERRRDYQNLKNRFTWHLSIRLTTDQLIPSVVERLIYLLNETNKNRKDTEQCKISKFCVEIKRNNMRTSPGVSLTNLSVDELEITSNHGNVNNLSHLLDINVKHKISLYYGTYAWDRSFGGKQALAKVSILCINVDARVDNSFIDNIPQLKQLHISAGSLYQGTISSWVEKPCKAETVTLYYTQVADDPHAFDWGYFQNVKRVYAQYLLNSNTILGRKENLFPAVTHLCTNDRHLLLAVCKDNITHLALVNNEFFAIEDFPKLQECVLRGFVRAIGGGEVDPNHVSAILNRTHISDDKTPKIIVYSDDYDIKENIKLLSKLKNYQYKVLDILSQEKKWDQQMRPFD